MYSIHSGSKAMLAIVAFFLATAAFGQTLRGSRSEFQDVFSLFLQELAAGSGSGAASERITEFEKDLAATYVALPKNEEGQLDHQTVRYMLHRLFVQRHGWHIKGLEPGGDTWSSDPEQNAEQAWVPSYLVDEFESRMEGGGANLGDLAVLGATLEDVAGQEVGATMKLIYRTLGFSTADSLQYEQARDIIDAYMVHFLGDGKWSIQSGMVSDFAGKHDYWKDTQAWFRGIEQLHLTTRDGSQENAVAFEKVREIAQDIAAQYSSYNDAECSKQKSALLGTWDKGNSTGRVRLRDFYLLGLNSEWSLTEKVDYLRALGALDETNNDMPMVIVPNYLTARPNCLQSTRLYSVCCRNECEALMGQLERNLSSPSASPDRISSFVSTLGSNTVHAPRQLTSEMSDRLEDIAIRHGGRVHIHGRLFAQWMHHAFPSECPYPHEAGSTDPVTPDEWLGSDVEATDEEIRSHVTQTSDVLVGEAANLVLPWTSKEELLGAKHIHLTDASTSLAFELTGASKARLQEFRSAMEPFYAAWPKDSDGLIEHQTARYVLHRLFVQRHRWFIKGLEPNGDVWHKNSTQDSLKDWVPAYLLNVLEERLGRRGLDLNDLAALGAAIEDLVHKEAEGSLGDVYQAMGLESATSREQLHQAISAYMVVYLGSGVYSLTSALTDEFSRKHSYWNATETWFSGVEAARLNIAADHNADLTVDFSEAAEIVFDIGARYGSYNDAECQTLKVAMMNMWGKGKTTGRVRLVDFYRLGLDSEWSLSEKASYLRAIGALDESNASSPMVIIPNYLSSHPNCLQSTSLYAICCRNECEDLMAEIERSIAAPAAAPERIATLVASLGSATVEAPRKLSQEMLARLEGIAATHGGEVNLHGRLFAQWMHHAFPSECPYPHEAGTSDPVSPDEWMSEEIEASEEDRRQHVEDDTCGPEQAAAEWAVELPWSHTEELLSSTAMMKLQKAKAPPAPSRAPVLGTSLLLVALLCAGVAAGAGMACMAPGKAWRRCVAFGRQEWRLVALTGIMVVAFAANMVNRFLIVFIAGSGLLGRLLCVPGQTAKAPEKVKFCV